MRILLIHQIFVAHKEVGGTRHFELAKILKRKGIDFTIVASDLNYLTGSRVFKKPKLIKTQHIEDLKVIRAYTIPLLHKSYTGRLLSFLSFMVTSILAGLKETNIDIVMGTSPPLFQGLSAYIISRYRKVPFVMEVRDLWIDFSVQLGVVKNRIAVLIAKKIENFLYNHADAVIVNSPGFIKHILNKGVNKNKIFLVPNGVHVKMFDVNNNGNEIRKKLRLNNKFIVLYAGAHGLANDLQTILLSAKILKDNKNIVFILIGDGKEKSNLVQMAKKLELENVLFLSPQPKSEIPKYIAASDVCVAILKPIPLFKTTYPNKVFDYMASGKPTILAIDGVIRKVIEEAQGGIFVPPGDPKALADAIIFYLENPKIKILHGKNAKNYVIKNFDREKQAVILKEILIQISKSSMKF